MHATDGRSGSDRGVSVRPGAPESASTARIKSRSPSFVPGSAENRPGLGGIFRRSREIPLILDQRNELACSQLAAIGGKPGFAAVSGRCCARIGGKLLQDHRNSRDLGRKKCVRFQWTGFR